MQRRPLFSASLRPNNSLTPRGRRWVIAILAIGASIPGIVFFAAGAWPVVGFLGLDILAVWWALSASMKSSHRAEHVSLYPDALIVRQFTADGDERTNRFNPFYVRLDVSRDPVGRVRALTLRSAETTLPIGTVLNPNDKASFAKAFGDALVQARR